MNNNISVQELNDRLIHLEQSNSRWRIASVATGLLLCLGLFSGMSPQNADSIRVKKIEVVDDNNNVRLIMKSGEDGPVLVLLNENKQPGIGIVSSQTTGSGISFFDDDQQVRLQLQLDSNGPAISYLDSNGIERLSSGARDGSAIGLRDEQGEPRMLFVVNPDGPQIYQFDKDGRVTKKID